MQEQEWLSKWPKWIRWLLFLPIAFLFQAMVRFMFFYIIPFYGLLEILAAGFTGTIAFLFGCYMIVPSRKILVTMIFSIYATIGGGIQISRAIYTPVYGQLTGAMIGEAIAVILGAGIGMYYFYLIDKKTEGVYLP